jgi:hypothetical protein
VLHVPDQKQEYQSFGSWPAMVDWDNDGDLDLLVGGFDGTMFVRLNEGTRSKPVLAATNTNVMVDDAELKVPDGHAAPAVADWDGDGLWDILAGSANGGVYWYRNTGTADAPAFGSEQVLVPKHEGSGYSEMRESGAEPQPGIRTQIAATDFNGDEKTDLLVGDFQSTITLRPDLTPAELAEFARNQDEVATIVAASIAARDAMGKAHREKYPGDTHYSEEAAKEWTRKYRESQESEANKAREARIEELTKAAHQYLVQPEKPGMFDDYETTHGYVWLYLRK